MADVDLLDGTITQFRFGVADETGRKSLTFGLIKQGAEAYLTSREFTDEKYSFHASGQHHFAEIEKRPGDGREVFENTQRLRLIDGEFDTVARVFFTTRTGWTNRQYRHGQNFFSIPPFAQNEVAIVSIGFTPHHPIDHPKTAKGNHIGVMQLTANRYLTVSVETNSQRSAAALAYERAALHPKANIYLRIKEVDGIYDHLIATRSHLNTYLIWAHHALETATADWFEHHAIGRVMREAQSDLIRGLYRGKTSEQVLAVRSPDWRRQLATMPRAPARSTPKRSAS